MLLEASSQSNFYW